MTDVWAIDLPDSQKIVLLALADCANDEGHCWPSMATLARKCSKGERTVQGVIKQLVDDGHLTRREVLGKGCNYTVHPRRDRTPAETAPPQGTSKTPAETAPHPRSGCGQTVKEPSKNRQPTPRKAQEGGKTIIPVDWKLPPASELPPQARLCAEQWTGASYLTHGEAFHSYWRSCRRMMADWTATWANRVVALHSQVMRDQKFGNAPKEMVKPADRTPEWYLDQAAFFEKIGQLDNAAEYRRLARGPTVNA